MTARRLLMPRWMLLGALLGGVASCAEGSGTDPGVLDEDAGEGDDSRLLVDAGKKKDGGGGGGTDSGESPDAGELDSGTGDDVGVEDAGVTPPADVGFDSGERDVPTAVDVGFDSGVRDVPAADVGFDVGTPDTGPRDTGTPDTGPRDTGVRDVPSCIPTTELFNGRDDDCDGVIDEGFSSGGQSLACTGSGRILLLPDGDIDDGGSTRDRDGLEVFCIAGSLRFCLTNEACPWRLGAPAVDSGQSCSSAGLSAPTYFMAYYITSYLRASGYVFDELYCPPTGRVRLALR